MKNACYCRQTSTQVDLCPRISMKLPSIKLMKLRLGVIIYMCKDGQMDKMREKAYCLGRLSTASRKI